MDFNAWEEEWSRRVARKAEKALQATAYHEAGHVVIRWHEQLGPPEVATIIPEGDVLGRVKGEGLPKGYEPYEDSMDDPEPIEKEIRELLAGPIAQKRFDPEGFDKDHAGSDWDMAVKWALHLGGDQETTEALLHQLETQAKDILDRLWDCVVAVADALLEHKELSGDEVWEIIEQVHNSMNLGA